MPTVAVTTQPTYNVGPITGFKAQGTIQGVDGEFKDDLLVQGDLEVVGTLYTDTVSFGDDLTLAADKDFTMGTGGSGTGTVKTGTGEVDLNGDVIIADGKNLHMHADGVGTFQTGAGTVSLNGDVTIAANMDLNMSGTATFTTGTGAVGLNGTTTVISGKTLEVTDADALKVANIIVPQKVVVTAHIDADSATQWVFVADAAYELLEIQAIFTVTSTSGTLDLYKSIQVEAPASGATMLTGTMSLAGTANTVVSGTKHDTAANRRLADGNTMSIIYGGTMTGLVGGTVTITLMRI